MYFSEADFKKIPYFYQAKEISRYNADIGNLHVWMKEGIITANSNASLTNEDGYYYKAPASSGVLSDSHQNKTFQFDLTITTSSGKTISRTIYVIKEYHYCSRNDDDVSTEKLTQ